MKTVYIIHGYNASSNDYWFPWLKQQVEAIGHQCEIIHFDDSQHPEYGLWKHNLAEQIQSLNENVVIIAHSLGCLASLGFLSEALQGSKLFALFLIAGFNRRLPTLPELNQFIDQVSVNDASLRLSFEHRFLFFSNNDPFVPAPFSIQLGHLMNAQMVEVKNAGHFMASDGFSEFPQLWDKLSVLLKSAP
ncbi:RBBP9/YdeN family alpha/beta hydrolase [Acinetobacter wuhouensis]|uniref:Serine hydrolase family protein n=1 Tax=Acinetobacter wuhouensis TaxID=1879050 RepID=A0A4Q7AFQ0_9GAMM|nr:alpha/beta hydrolase [Acinetobacter wuhouensis]RZG43559.1 serine hydrolase family protein [Acinetobacter wuhouensis]RZG70326.1 serine hydrolase family protein [Acinetobacter wuhouensis]